jgi:hypothetical protein
MVPAITTGSQVKAASGAKNPTSTAPTTALSQTGRMLRNSQDTRPCYGCVH